MRACRLDGISSHKVFLCVSVKQLLFLTLAEKVTASYHVVKYGLGVRQQDGNQLCTQLNKISSWQPLLKILSDSIVALGCVKGLVKESLNKSKMAEEEKFETVHPRVSLRLRHIRTVSLTGDMCFKRPLEIQKL